MNTKRLIARKDEEGVTNERLPPHLEQVPVIGVEDENEEVPYEEPQVSL